MSENLLIPPGGCYYRMIGVCSPVFPDGIHLHQIFLKPISKSSGFLSTPALFMESISLYRVYCSFFLLWSILLSLSSLWLSLPGIVLSLSSLWLSLPGILLSLSSLWLSLPGILLSLSSLWLSLIAIFIEEIVVSIESIVIYI